MERRPAHPAPWLAQTKFAPPAARPDLVARARLTEPLTTATTTARLTLVTAPAGYGKTTLVADWLAAQPAGVGAWLTLDEDDNDPARFLTAVITALRRVAPACGVAALAMLGEPTLHGAEIRRIVSTLINDLLEGLVQPTVLVLDDLQLITTPEIYLALDYLLEHLPPRLHLLVLTRQDPALALARLRARGELAEVRLPALRFTTAETTTFLNDRLRLGLPPDQIAALQRRTEGWPVGLRLLAGALERGTPAPAAFLAALDGAAGYLFDFLAEEVLRHQTVEVRRFLLETAILPTLTPARCAAVTGRADAGPLLATLAGRNLFLSPVAGLAATYQYHALFAEFLCRQLAQEYPAQVAELHRRAAAAETVPGQAIAHYLAAGLGDAAADRIAEAAEDALQQGWVETVRGWILALPEPIQAAQPRLRYLLGVCEWHRGALPTAVRLLEAARPGLAAAEDTGAEGRCLAYLALHAALQYRFAAALEYLDAALARPLPPVLRAHLLIEQAHALLMSQQRAAALTALNAALDLGEESGDPTVIAVLLRYYHPPFGVLPGAFARLASLCALADRYPLDPTSPAGVSLARHWITLHLLQGDSAAAIRQGEETLARTQAAGPNFQAQMVIYTTLAQAYYISGQPERAAALLEELATGLAELAAHPAVYTVLLFLWGRACWAAGRLDAAHTLHARLRARLIPVLEMQAADEILGGVLAWAAGDLAGAERRLRAMAAVEDDLLALALNTSPRLLLAALYVTRARPQEALDTLEQVLARYPLAGGPGYLMREGTVIVPLLRLAVAEGRHADVAGEVLRLLGAAAPPPPPAAARRSPLPPGRGDTGLISPREHEVLRLLATGASNRAIAAQLVIGEQTVKTHLIHLFRKLDVTTRTGAVQRARDLGLI